MTTLKTLGKRGCVGYDDRGALLYWEPGGTPEPAEGASLIAILMGWIQTLEQDKETIKADPPARTTQRKRTTKTTMATKKTTKSKNMKTTNKTTTKTADAWLAEMVEGDGQAIGRALMKQTAELRKTVIDLAVASVDEDDDDALWELAHLERDPRAVDALIRLAKDGDGDVRTTAIAVLGVLESRPARALSVLLRAVGDGDEDVVSEAADALAEYADPSTIAPLEKALAKVQKNRRWVYGIAAENIFGALAAAATKGTATDRTRVVGILANNLAPPESRYAALPAFRALIAMGGRAKAALPKLEQIASSEDAYLATLARHAISAIRGDYAPHLAAIKTAAKSKDSAVKAVAKSALEDANRSAKKSR